MSIPLGIPDMFLFSVIVVALGFLLLPLITVLYHRYLEGKTSSKTKPQFILLSCGYSILVAIYLLFCTGFYFSLSIVIGVIFIVIALIVIVLIIYELCRRVSQITQYCTDGFNASVKGIEFTVCSSLVYNARYDRFRKRFYITEPYYRILNEDEAYAVMLHEKGHSLPLDSIALVIPFGVWFATTGFYIASYIFLIVFATMKVYDCLPVSAVTVATLHILKPITAVFAILNNWIREHECDLYALREAGYKPLASALLKAHICISINDYSQCTKKLEENLEKLEKTLKITYSKVLKTLLKFGCGKPLDHTHPLLEFRIYKLLNEGKFLEHRQL